MNCDQINAQLDDYLDGHLGSVGRQAFEAHVTGCSACSHRLTHARTLQNMLVAYPVEPPSDGFEARVLAKAARPAALPARRPPRIVAAGFVVAFAASILTVIYTGLLVGPPKSNPSSGPPMVSMSIEESRVVNLVFASSNELEGVSLLVDLPAGVELLGYEGLRQVRWKTRLQAGKNVLPLELVALGGMGGQLTARLVLGDKEKVFRVNVSVI